MIHGVGYFISSTWGSMEAGVYAAYLQQATHSADAETPIRPPPIRPDIRSVLGDMLGILYALKIK